MLLQFSDTTNKKGIVQVLARMTNTSSSSSTSYPLLDKTVDINMALANFFIIANQSSGRYQIDDTNHTDYPVIFGNLVAGQQDYSFTVDANGNQILDIYKVRIKDINGNWKTLIQRDLQDGDDTALNNSTQTGSPDKYDLTANGIFLTDIPSYNSTNGLEIYVSRGANYFDSTDTTKKAGIPEIFHEYLALRPAYFYCVANGLTNLASQYRDRLYGTVSRAGRVQGMEDAIRDYFSNRNRDERFRFNVNNKGANSCR